VGSLIFPALEFFCFFFGAMPKKKAQFQKRKFNTKIISSLTFFAEAEKK
jgi:hypothetical protein